MTDQVETKQVTWEDLEVAPEKRLSGEPRIDDFEGISHEELAHMRNVMITVNVSLTEWQEALDQATEDFMAEGLVPVYRYAGRGQFEQVSAFTALCTLHRDPLTGHMEE